MKYLQVVPAACAIFIVAPVASEARAQQAAAMPSVSAPPTAAYPAVPPESTPPESAPPVAPLQRPSTAAVPTAAGSPQVTNAPYGYWAPPVLIRLPNEYVYRRGTGIPPGYHLEERRSSFVLTISTVDLAGPYVLGLAIAAGSHFRNESGWLFLPVLGPAFTLGNRHVSTEEGTGGVDILAGVGLFVDGLFQVIGAAGLLKYALLPDRWVVRDGSSSVRLMPYSARGAAGLQLVGAF